VTPEEAFAEFVEQREVFTLLAPFWNGNYEITMQKGATLFGSVTEDLGPVDTPFVAFPDGEAPRGASVDVGSIDENRMLLLEDGHCLKDHALAACNRPELRAQAAMMGTSLHTLVQMVDNGLGVTFVPAMAIDAGILEGTRVDAKPLRSDHGFRRIALIWRRSSPREDEFQLLAAALRRIIRDVIRVPGPADGADARQAALEPTCD